MVRYEITHQCNANPRSNKIYLSLQPSSKSYHLSYSVYASGTFNIVDPSIMQDECNMKITC